MKKGWALYTWELGGLGAPSPIPSDYELRSGRTDELGDMLGVIAAALGADDFWKERIGATLGRLNARMRATLGRADCDYLVVTTRGSASDLVGVSGVSPVPANGQHFLTGICVHPRHQRRGLGSGLLSRSLHRLHDMGARVARVYAEEGSVADRYLYPLFDSTRVADVPCEPAEPVRAQRLMRGWVRLG